MVGENFSMRKFFLLLLALALFSACLAGDARPVPARTGPRACWTLDECIRLEVVSTTEARQRGLMFRDTLSPGHGMLFVFPSGNASSIWMKNMRFSIDILWLDGTGKIVGAKENAPPCAQEPCEVYSAPSASPSVTAPAGAFPRFVLEVPAGFLKAQGLAVGSRLKLEFIYGDA